MSSARATIAVCVSLAVLLTACGRKNGVPTSTSDRAHFDWYLRTSAGDYMEAGDHNPKWDPLVLRAFTNLSIMRVWGDRTNTTRFEWCSDVNRAVEEGCKDPLVLYLQLRCDDGTGHAATDETFRRWTNATYLIERSGYSPIRKFYAELRAAIALKSASGTNFPKDIHYFRRQAMNIAGILIASPDTPLPEAFSVANDMLEVIDINPGQKWDFVPRVEFGFQQNWPRSWQRYLLEGRFEIDRAWKARGTGLADTVSADEWKEFATHLGKAKTALEKAWKINPQEEIAVKMIKVELGQGRGRDRMETWFERAMALNTNSWNAVYAKYNYLLPQWYGSFEQQLEFARECVDSKKWGGRVPLIMLDFYDNAFRNARDKKEAFRNPVVWEDIRSAFEKFFRLNPNADGWHHNYFWYAYMCGQWEEAKRQLDLMGSEVNYSYFGGQDQFKVMADEVRARTGGAGSNAAPVKI